MARFELHDGSLKKFWEIELRGDTLHFRMGDIGTPGRTRSKRHRNEQSAEEAYEKAIRAMMAQGYEQLPEEDEEEEPVSPSWSRLQNDPLDRDALRDHAAWLTDRDDPRGPVLTRVLALHEAERSQELEMFHEEHRTLLLGIPEDFPGTIDVDSWGIGHARRATVRSASSDGATALLQQEGLTLVEELHVELPGAVESVLANVFPVLHTLHIDDTASDVAGRPLDLDRLSVKAPRLRTLRMRGPAAITGSDAVTGLLHLDMVETSGWLEAIVRARPALQSLRVAAATPDGLLEIRQQGLLDSVDTLEIMPAWDTDLGDILQVLEGLRLERLSLRGVLLLPAHADTLVRFAQIAHLSLTGAITRDASASLARRNYEGDLVEQEAHAAAPPRPAGLPLVELEREGERWSIGIDGPHHHIRRRPAKGRARWSWSRFPTPEAATEAARYRLEQKLREGYRKVAGDA